MNRAINSSYDLQRYFEEYQRGNQFTFYAFEALYQYLEQYEEDTGESLTVDPVGLSCDYTEYESAREALKEYHIRTHHLTEVEALDLLEQHTAVIRVSDYIDTGEGNTSILVLNY